ncbi:DUF7562 family protein [Halosegnis marinus]|uniref:Small CPxCG-related zinc finger protein n=1 Tax=Halosegnis marinus TaxID=3034023 RepID=A0ABD5ZNF5_9EURY|nr:hypothetical protein [Halosegnis sp. DT85]
MWGNRDRATQVTCIACGDTVSRTDAREYDKEGDRYDRRDKEFEYLCKPCHRDIDHQPRGNLESLLAESGAGETDREAFLTRYAELATERGPRSESER